jgi:hypothetical protein
MLSVPMLAPSLRRRAGMVALGAMLLVTACKSDLFHDTDWKTLCDVDASAAPCQAGAGGGGGAGGAGGAGGGCTACAELLRADVMSVPAGQICPTSRDLYDLLQACRCKAEGPCYANCSLVPACGGTASDVSACEACMQTSCGLQASGCAQETP